MGIGLAIVASFKGYKLKLVIPDNFSREKINILKEYGAEMIDSLKKVDYFISVIRKNDAIGDFSTLISSIKIDNHSIIRNKISKNLRVLSRVVVQLIKNDNLKNINFNVILKL